MPLFTVPTWAAAKLFFKSKKFLIPAVTIALLLAVGGGTYYYLTNQQEKAVTEAVKSADANATIRTYETKEVIYERTIEVDRKFDALEDQTIKDYSNVRNQIETAPPEVRDAQAPALLIDTLNELDRVRRQRETSGVSDPDVPVG